jgi:hypothetical protein
MIKKEKKIRRERAGWVSKQVGGGEKRVIPIGIPTQEAEVSSGCSLSKFHR